VAWQRFCAQAAEALRAPHDPERLTKALALAQGGAVALEDDGYALVTKNPFWKPLPSGGGGKKG
jgi:hypothetical protein